LIVRPPIGDADAYFGFCEHLGLWRIVAPPVDAHGVIDPETGIDGFHLALAAAIGELRCVRPALADAFASLLPEG
jgi:hypothetical protein